MTKYIVVIFTVLSIVIIWSNPCQAYDFKTIVIADQELNKDILIFIVNLTSLEESDIQSKKINWKIYLNNKPIKTSINLYKIVESSHLTMHSVLPKNTLKFSFETEIRDLDSGKVLKPARKIFP